MNIKILSDPICPICFLSIAVMDELMKEYDIEVEWINVNAHPHFGDGIKLSVYKESYDGYLESKNRYKGIAREFGQYIPFQDYIPSPQPALNAIYEAKKVGRGGAFKRLIMNKYHVHGEDIGDMVVILDTARELGIDEDRIRKAVEEGRHNQLIAQNTAIAHQFGMKAAASGVIVIDDKEFIETAFRAPGNMRGIIEHYFSN